MSGIGTLLAGAAPYGAMPGGGSGLSVTASPPSSDGGGSAAPFSTPPVTAIPAGGSGSYTYAWSAIEGNYAISIDSPTAQTTGLRFLGVAFGALAVGTVRCTATDTVTGAMGSVDVPLSYARQGEGVEP